MPRCRESEGRVGIVLFVRYRLRRGSTEAMVVTTPETLSDDKIQHYRDKGFVKVPGILSKDEAAEFHDIIYRFAERKRSLGEEDPGVRDLSLIHI